MVSFLLPGFLIGAAAIAAGVIAIHFIVTREPRTVPLPTARFAPKRPVRARARTFKPQDLLLMLLRVLLVLAVGAALARPVFTPNRRAVGHIVLVDRSRAVADARVVADSARALLGAGDALVLFDTAATVVHASATDSLAKLTTTGGPARLSPALIAALRAASLMREQADSFEIAIVSPLALESVDDASAPIREIWPAKIRVVQTPARSDSLRAGSITVAGPTDDAFRLAVPLRRGAIVTRIVRGALSASDSAWARSGNVLVHWPIDAAVLSHNEWTSPSQRDTVGAVNAGDVTVVAPFERRVEYGADSGDASAAARHASSSTGAAATAVGTGRVVARWVDGRPAAVERALGSGCIRTVAIDVPSRGDLVLQPRFQRLVSVLSEPCGGRGQIAPVDKTVITRLAGTAKTSFVKAGAIAPPVSVPSPLATWLFVAAMVFAAGELLLRRRIAGTTSRDVVEVA